MAFSIENRNTNFKIQIKSIKSSIIIYLLLKRIKIIIT